MQTDSNLTLEQRTEMYWGLSFMFNGRIESTIPTGDAIEWCSHVANLTRPDLSIRKATRNLLDEIVAGGSIWMGECWDNVLPLAPPARKLRRKQQA